MRLHKVNHKVPVNHSVLTKRCAFRRRAKVAVDSVDSVGSRGDVFRYDDYIGYVKV